MKKLVVAPAGPPGPIPGDHQPTDPVITPPRKSVALEPNKAPPVIPQTDTSREEEGEREEG